MVYVSSLSVFFLILPPEMPILLRLVYARFYWNPVVLDTFFQHVSNKVGAGKNHLSTHGGGFNDSKVGFFHD